MLANKKNSLAINNNKTVLGFAFMFVLMLSAVVLGQEGIEHYKIVHTSMHSAMVPLHIAQIGISLLIAVYALLLIRQTRQTGTFAYVLIAMIFFIFSSIVSYLPHANIMQDDTSQAISLAITTIALILIAVTFNIAVRATARN